MLQDSKTGNNQLAGVTWGLVGVLAFSFTLPMTRIALQRFTPSQVMIWRIAIASILGATAIVLFRMHWPRRIEFLSVCLCSAGTVFGFPIFITLAMTQGTAVDGAIVIGLLPLSTAVLAVVINGERPPVKFWICALLGTFVIVSFVVQRSGLQIAHKDIYLFLAVASAAMGYGFGGKAASTLGGWQACCWSLTVSCPITIPLALFSAPISVASVTSSHLAMGYLAIVSQFLGFFAWYRGMAMASIASVSQTQLLQIFLTLLWSWILLGERVGTTAAVAAIAVGALVWMGIQSRANT